MNFGRLREQVALHLIGTPLDEPLRRLRSVRETLDRRAHPEWNSVRDEGRAITHLVKAVIKPDMNCIDIGCHLGSMISSMRRLAPLGRHMAFEPTPYKLAWLTRKYPDVEVRGEALSDRPGEAEFFYRPDHSGYSGLRSHGDPSWKMDTFKVTCARLDDLVGERHVGFIKIDVEGAEPLVMRGATGIIAKSRPHLLFECTMTGLSAFSWTPDAMYGLVADEFGYDIYMIQDYLDRRGPLTKAAFLKAMSHPAQAFNFFATSK